MDAKRPQSAGPSRAASGPGIDAPETALQAACTQRRWDVTEGVAAAGREREGAHSAGPATGVEAVAACVVVPKLGGSGSVLEFATLLGWFTDADAPLRRSGHPMDASTAKWLEGAIAALSARLEQSPGTKGAR